MLIHGRLFLATLLLGTNVSSAEDIVDAVQKTKTTTHHDRQLNDGTDAPSAYDMDVFGGQYANGAPTETSGGYGGDGMDPPTLGGTLPSTLGQLPNLDDHGYGTDNRAADYGHHDFSFTRSVNPNQRRRSRAKSNKTNGGYGNNSGGQGYGSTSGGTGYGDGGGYKSSSGYGGESGGYGGDSGGYGGDGGYAAKPDYGSGYGGDGGYKSDSGYGGDGGSGYGGDGEWDKSSSSPDYGYGGDGGYSKSYTDKPTKKPTYRPTDKPTKKPTDKPTRKPTPSPTSWSGDGHDNSNNSGDSSRDWSSSDWEDYVNEDPEKCRQVERETCCSQNTNDGRTEDDMQTVCKLMGCNLKKCGKRDDQWGKESDGDDSGDSDSGDDSEDSSGEDRASDWSGDSHDDPTQKPTSWSGDAHSSSSSSWSGDAHSGDAVYKNLEWSSDGVGEWTGDGNSDDKCTQAERDACCTQKDEVPNNVQSDVCDVLGCNIKKCGKRDDQWGKDSEWSDSGSDDNERSSTGDWNTKSPTKNPSWNKEWRVATTPEPTKKPSWSPSKDPTKKPTRKPTRSPSKNPTKNPTWSPSKKPTKKPTKAPTWSPSKKPTRKPTRQPTRSPTKSPTKKPTYKPSWNTDSPTKKPTPSPTTTWNGSAEEEDDKWGSVVDVIVGKCTNAERDVCCDQNPNKRSYEERAHICDKLGCNVKKCNKRDNSDTSGGDYGSKPSGYGSTTNYGSKPSKKPTRKPSSDGYNNNKPTGYANKPTGYANKPSQTTYSGGHYGLSSPTSSAGYSGNGGNNNPVGNGNPIPGQFHQIVHEECDDRRMDPDNGNVCVEVCTKLTKIMSGEEVIDEHAVTFQRRCQ